jgi:hypothetical protein
LNRRDAHAAEDGRATDDLERRGMLAVTAPRIE